MITETDPRPIKELTEDQLQDYDQIQFWYYCPFIPETEYRFLKISNGSYHKNIGFHFPPFHVKTFNQLIKLLLPSITHYSIIRDV